MYRYTLITLLLFSCEILPAQIILNGDFELPADSTWVFGEGEPLSIVADTSNGGGYVLAMHSSVDRGRSVSQLAPLPHRTLTRYAIDARIKTTLAEGGEFRFWTDLLDHDEERLIGTRFDLHTDSTAWDTFTYYFLADTTLRHVRLGGSVSGEGTVWLDDIRIRPAPLDFDTITTTPEVEAYIDLLIDSIRSQAVRRSLLDLDALKNSILYYAIGAEGPEDVHRPIKSVLYQLGDNNHSNFFTPAEIEAMLGGMDIRELMEGEEDSPYITDPPLDKDSLRAELRFGEGRLIDGTVGYLSLPGFMHGHMDALVLFIDSLQVMLRDFDREEKLAGWVIDLRNSTGGATPAMIGSVGPLLSSDNVAYYVRTDGEVDNAFSYQSGSYYNISEGGADSIAIVTSTIAYRVNRPDLPIAVLIGPRSASAAEGLLTLLLGEPRVRTFGQPTAGLTTGNGMVLMPDDAALNLASSYLATRNKTMFTGPIDPHVLVEEEDGEEDAVLERALQWIRNGGK